MSRESKKRTKEWLGRSPSIVIGRDVIETKSIVAISGLAVTVGRALGAGAGNVFSTTVHKPGVVDAFLADVYPALTSGVISVALYINNVVKASGSMSLTVGSRNKEWFWGANGENELVVASGHTIQTQYSVPTAVNDNGQTGYYISTRTLISYTE